MSRHSVGTYKGNELILNSPVNARPQSPQLDEPLWHLAERVELACDSKPPLESVQEENDSSNLPPKSSEEKVSSSSSCALQSSWEVLGIVHSQQVYAQCCLPSSGLLWFAVWLFSFWLVQDLSWQCISIQPVSNYNFWSCIFKPSFFTKDMCVRTLLSNMISCQFLLCPRFFSWIVGLSSHNQCKHVYIISEGEKKDFTFLPVSFIIHSIKKCTQDFEFINIVHTCPLLFLVLSFVQIDTICSLVRGCYFEKNVFC